MTKLIDMDTVECLILRGYAAGNQRTAGELIEYLKRKIENPPEESKQPELPKLRNNDQRKDWLKNYKTWGLWYRDENIDVNYYKYDFADGSRLVVAEYPQREQAWKCVPRDEHYYHLLEKGRRKAGTTDEIYDHQYIQYADSETYLVEFLKNLQKGEK